MTYQRIEVGGLLGALAREMRAMPKTTEAMRGIADHPCPQLTDVAQRIVAMGEAEYERRVEEWHG